MIRIKYKNLILTRNVTPFFLVMVDDGYGTTVHYFRKFVRIDDVPRTYLFTLHCTVIDYHVSSLDVVGQTV